MCYALDLRYKMERTSINKETFKHAYELYKAFISTFITMLVLPVKYFLLIVYHGNRERKIFFTMAECVKTLTSNKIGNEHYSLPNERNTMLIV